MVLLLLLEEVLELQQLLLELLLVEHVWEAPSEASLRQNTGGRGRHRLRGWRVSAQQPLSRGAAAAAAHSFTEPIPPCCLLLPPGVIASGSLWKRFPNPTSQNPLPPSPARGARRPSRSPRRGRAGTRGRFPSLRLLAPPTLTARPAAITAPRPPPPSSRRGQQAPARPRSPAQPRREAAPWAGLRDTAAPAGLGITPGASSQVAPTRSTSIPHSPSRGGIEVPCPSRGLGGNGHHLPRAGQGME